MIDRSVAYQRDGGPLGKWQRQLKKRSGGEMVLILDWVLFLMGSAGSENTRLFVEEKKRKVYFCCLRLARLTQR